MVNGRERKIGRLGLRLPTGVAGGRPVTIQLGSETRYPNILANERMRDSCAIRTWDTGERRGKKKEKKGGKGEKNEGVGEKPRKTAEKKD